MPDPLDHAHLVGIGGAGMSGIARILLARGKSVSGSDAKQSRAVEALRMQGARIAVGHAASNLDDPTSVIISTAIRESNPELAEARRRGIPVLHRSEALAALMAGQRVACIAGTHGKTSTTSMLTVALQHCRLDPSFAIGGDLNESGANAHHGSGDIFVAEADESDGSFLAFSPWVAVVTNVEADHLDHHGTVERYQQTFDAFVTRIEPGGLLIACADDPGSAALADRAEAAAFRVRRYGRSTEDVAVLGYEPGDAGGIATISLAGAEVRLPVPVPGKHMALNAVAALLAGLELGAPLPQLIEGIAAFTGVRRRFELRGTSGGVRVYDDYAHHPSEVDAQLRAVLPGTSGRLVVVFQPHLYSRTRLFADRFAEALSHADEVVVLDVFGAREEPEPGVSGELIAKAVTSRVRYEPSFEKVPGLVADLVASGDVVITMGAGDVTMLGPEILAELDRR